MVLWKSYCQNTEAVAGLLAQELGLAAGAFYYYKINYGRLLSNKISTVGFFKIVLSSKINCYNEFFELLKLFFLFSLFSAR
jgi:hypothetical protein